MPEADRSLVSRIEGGQRQPTREPVAKLRAGCVPPSLPVGSLRAAPALVSTASDEAVEAARRRIAVARGAGLRHRVTS